MQNLRATGIFEDFLSLFFPRYCQACNQGLIKSEKVICTRCMLQLPRVDDFADPQNALQNRLSLRLPVNHAMSFLRFTKNGRVQRLLHALKYKGEADIGVFLGRLFATKIVDANVPAFDLIVPVPLHPARRRKRGYNQSAKFAEGLSEILNIPYSDNVLRRLHATETQTRKSKLGRWQNIDHAFAVTDPAAVANKRILLVDDVVTTGSTLEACGITIIESGCAALSIACIAEA